MIIIDNFIRDFDLLYSFEDDSFWQDPGIYRWVDNPIAQPTTLIKNGFLVAVNGVIRSICIITQLVITHKNTELYAKPIPGTPDLKTHLYLEPPPDITRITSY